MLYNIIVKKSKIKLICQITRRVAYDNKQKFYNFQKIYKLIVIIGSCNFDYINIIDKAIQIIP